MAALAACLFIVSGTFFFPADDFRLLQRMLFESIICLMFAIGVLWLCNKWFTLFFILAGISEYFPFYTVQSYRAFHAVFYGAIWFCCLVMFVKDRDVDVLMDAICILALVNVGWMIVQFFNLDPIFKPARNSGGADPVVGFLGNRNLISAYLAISMPAFFRGRWKWGLMPLIGGLCMAKTSLGMLSAGIGFIFFEAMNKRFLTCLILVVAACVAYVFVIDSPGFERWDVWIIAWGGWLKHWFMGYGIGHWKVIFYKPIVTGTVWKTPHNEFVQMLFEMGIFVVPIFAGYLWRVFKNVRHHTLIPATAIIIIAANSFANFPFHVAPTAMLALIWMAIMEIQSKEVDHEKKLNIAY